MRFVQRIEIGDAQRVPVQFAHLMFEQCDSIRMILLGAKLTHARIDVRPLARGIRYVGAKCGVIAECIEQIKLARLFEQRLMFVLSVNFDQQRGERLQLRERRRTSIDPGARRSFAADDAAQLARIAIVERFFDEPRARRVRPRERELRHQFRALGAVPNDARFRALTRQQKQCIDHQRLARAGFASDDGEAVGKGDVGLADDREILDEKCFQHARGR